MQENGSLVAVTLQDRVLEIRLNRPEKKNALNGEMYSAMTEALQNASASPETRVVLFAGGPNCFTSGNDLMDFMTGMSAGENHPVVHFLRALLSFEKPMIAAVNGAAVGIGTTLLLHCDLAYASGDAWFQMPFVNLGLCPEAASSVLLPLAAGPRRASETILLGRRFSAEEAHSWGLLNGLTASGQADDAARDAARLLAAQPPEAVRVSRRLLREPFRQAAEDALNRELAAFLARLTSPEAAESFAAFFEKRPPDFSKFS